jgi:FAD/FMN-containing dehydrogenase
MVSVSFEPELAADAARELRGTLRGGVIAATDQTYDTARRIWNGAIDRHPALIARPENEREVVAAIDVARKYRLPLAVRGGAHDFAGRAGSCGQSRLLRYPLLRWRSGQPVPTLPPY